MMIIGTDGACRWGGTPECVSCGVAFIRTDDTIEYLSKVEAASTSQRGELNGILIALTFAKKYIEEHVGYIAENDIIIITDSEYLYNSIMKEWCFKWRNNDWCGSTGDTVKNVDLWEQITELLIEIGTDKVFLQWTKGHLISGLTPSIVKRVMHEDPTGVALYSNVCTIANRGCEGPRIAKDFNKHRVKQDVQVVPDEVAIDWTVTNVVADLLAGYIKDVVITAGKI